MSLQWDGGGATNVTGTVFTQCTANLVFSDDNVRAFYVDWDDGTDPDGNYSNKKEYANYQWVQVTKPTGSFDVKHTYTSTGTFKPLIQTINSDGFVSAYYGSETTNTDVSPYYDGGGDFTHYDFIASDGQATGILNVENKRVLSGIDNSIFEKQAGNVAGGNLYIAIPPLETAANMAYLGNIELELTLEVRDPLMDKDQSPEAQAGYGSSIQVITQTLTSAQVTGGSGLYQVDGTVDLEGPVQQVLKVRWMNPKYSGTSRGDDYTVNQAYNKIKIFLVTDGTVNGTKTYHPVAYVTAGRPIKSVDDPTRFVTLDFSQSRAKASNVTNLQYRYDLGKVFFNPVFQWNTLSGASAVYPTNSDNLYQYFGNNTVLSGSSTKNVSYAYNSVRSDGLNGQATITTPSIAFNTGGTVGWNIDDGTSQVYRTNQFLIDDYGRFTPQYHLARTSMQPASQLSTATPAAAYPPTTSATELTSSINANKPLVFRITPAVEAPQPGDSGMPWSSTPAETKIWQWTGLDFNVGNNGVATNHYTDEAFQNGSTNMVDLSSLNGASFKDGAGVARTANEYLLLMWPKKTNKIFFNINNYAKDLISKNISGSSFTSPWEIAGVSYLHIDNKTVSGTQQSGINQDVYWKSIPFEDTTKVSLEYKDESNEKYVEQSNSLSQSGYISFDMPLDWDACNMKDLCGGYFSEAIPNYDADGNIDYGLEFRITGTVADYDSGTADGKYGSYLQFTRTGGQDLTDIWNTKEDCGAFKYIAHILTWTGGEGGAADSMKRTLWLCGETGSSSWNGSTGLTLLYGKDISGYYDVSKLNGATGVVLSVKRINVYDVFNGCSKVDSSGDANIWIPTEGMWDQSWTSRIGQTYVCSGNGTSATGLTTEFGKHIYYNFKSTDHYLLKISLSGTVGTHTFPEVWNIFDATESHVEIIKEIDDSAYNLNSLAVTNDLQITRAGTYYRAISKKGKVFISRTGDSIQTLRFSSVALGDSDDTTAWTSALSPSSASSLYGHLHMVRKLQQDNVDVYWDEKQKDGTYVRFWGIITDLNENHAVGGPRAPVKYNFTLTIKEIALLDTSSRLMTDVFPLGGIQSAASYT